MAVPPLHRLRTLERIFVEHIEDAEIVTLYETARQGDPHALRALTALAHDSWSSGTAPTMRQAWASEALEILCLIDDRDGVGVRSHLA